MLKELLKQQQPVVYQALLNARKSNRVSHAYLFFGPAGTPKKEAAILLAQSIFCEKQEPLACEECNTCRRVAELNHGDLIYLNGAEKMIRKENVDAIQSRFSMTALETSGSRVYIIDHAENATAGAMNSMLKFLEEPGSGITAILTAENLDRLLPTVISRCTLIPFVPMKASAYCEEAVSEGVDPADAYFLSHTVRDIEQIKTAAASEEYAQALAMLKQYLNVEKDRAFLLIDYERGCRSMDREQTRQTLSMFFDLLKLFFHDVILGDGQPASWYHEAVQKAAGKPLNYAGMIQIAEEEKDRCNHYNDLNLVMAQAVCRLEETENER